MTAAAGGPGTRLGADWCMPPAVLRERLDVTGRKPIHGETPVPGRGKLAGGADHQHRATSSTRRLGMALLAVVAVAVLVAVVAARWAWA